MTVHVAVISIELDLPACHTLKEKRGTLKSLIAALHDEFHCSVAEIDQLDTPRVAVLACAAVSNDGRHAHKVVQKIPGWIERRRPDLTVIDFAIDLR
ncbi:MAG TPA: DUF503 domain-containing protein [Anaerolineales bacterium]|nr:DUF503 domain-containing protein [Anaerolineales bacterium]